MARQGIKAVAIVPTRLRFWCPRWRGRAHSRNGTVRDERKYAEGSDHPDAMRDSKRSPKAGSSACYSSRPKIRPNDKGMIEVRFDKDRFKSLPQQYMRAESFAV